MSTFVRCPAACFLFISFLYIAAAGYSHTREDVANSNGAKLLRATVREVPELARDARSLYQVSSDDASFLIMHGDQDPGVPLYDLDVLVGTSFKTRSCTRQSAGEPRKRPRSGERSYSRSRF